MKAMLGRVASIAYIKAPSALWYSFTSLSASANFTSLTLGSMGVETGRPLVMLKCSSIDLM